MGKLSVLHNITGNARRQAAKHSVGQVGLPSNFSCRLAARKILMGECLEGHYSSSRFQAFKVSTLDTYAVRMYVHTFSRAPLLGLGPTVPCLRP